MNFASIRKRLRSLRWPVRRLDPRLRLGRRGERAAARYLKRRRYRILVRNYQCPVGEIDLIGAQGNTIVFVEVKTRSGDPASNPDDALRPRQQGRIERAAKYFLMTHAIHDRPCRFDVVTVVFDEDGARRIEHFEDAFPARRP